MAHTQRSPYGRKYPWDRWFGKRWFRVSRGKDYEGRTDTFIQQVRNAARSRNLNVRISVLRSPTAEEITVTVGQVVEPGQVLKGVE